MREAIAMLALAAGASGQAHRPAFEGKWYPADRAALEKLLDHCYSVAAKRTGGAPPRKQLRALVAPHAALQYSGTTAAAAYRLLDKPRNAIVLGFSHRRLFSGVVSPRVTAYVTPLGELRVNQSVVKELGFRTAPEEELCDHSLESQLPFLQRAVLREGIVPLYVGELSSQEMAQAAERLARRMEQGDVVIASSDFTHYGEAYGYTPFPNDKELPGKLFQRAMTAFEKIGTLEVGEFDRFLAATGDTTCGRSPIRLLMAALSRLKEDIYLGPVDYLTSGELLKNYSMSVTYGALAFYPASAFTVSEADQKKLLNCARQTMDRYLVSGNKDRTPPPAGERGPDLEQRAGVFITVKKNGKLRGCVGSLFGTMPLYEAVADRTVAAASEDPRFPPVTAADGPLVLEVSLLTPLKRLKDWRGFKPGLGAVIVLNGKQGLLLPQIAEENGWTPQQFLENLARKAGLPPQSYRDSDAALYVYGAQVFRETAPPARATGDGRP